jgi:hypothetical protein
MEKASSLICRLNVNSLISDLTSKVLFWGLIIGLLLSADVPADAQVPASDITLQPVITDNLPQVASLTSFGDQELMNAFPSWTQLPLFTPFDAYDHGADFWWNEMASAQTQARLPIVMLAGGGYVTGSNTPVDLTSPWGIGNESDNMIPSYFAALSRRGSANTLKFGFNAGLAQFSPIYCAYYGLPNGTPYDFSNHDAWNTVVWQRIIKPWFENVPSSYWANVNGKVPIEFWGLNETGPGNWTNQQGNISQMMDYIAAQLQATYGVSPGFVMGSLNCDTTLQTCPYLLGDNEWFGPPTTAYTVTAFPTAPATPTSTVVGMVPGYINPSYFDTTSSDYNNLNVVLQRNNVSGTGQNGDTFKSGLNAMVSSNATLDVIEGFEDESESTAQFRTVPGTQGWNTPNQYINILRSYCDPRSVTLRLDAASCDNYYKLSGSPATTVYRRTGNLGVRCLVGPVVITTSSANLSPSTPGGPSPGSNAFDLDPYTFWWSAPGTSSGWLQYDCGSGNPRVVTGYDVLGNNYTNLNDPSSWTFQASNDATTWTTLDTETNQPFTVVGNNQQLDYTISNTTAYRYYRLNISSTVGGASYPIQLSELALVKTPSTANEDWVVTSTAAGEWIEHDSVFLSAGNYKFPLVYSSTAPHQVQLLVDGVAQPVVTLPASGSMNTFTSAYIGQTGVSHGAHNLRVVFVDGGIDVDYLFVKKYDPMVSLQSSLTSGYASALLGGNGGGLTAQSATVGTNQQFSMDDLQADSVITDANSRSRVSPTSGGPWLEPCSEGGYDMGNINNGSYAVFNNISLTGITSFIARTASAGAGGTIAVHLDSPTGTLVGTCTVPVTGNWQTYSTQTCPIIATTGTHTLYLLFSGGSGGLFNLEWFGTQGALNQILASTYNSASPTSGGPWLEPCSEGGYDMGNINNGSYAVFNNVNLNGVTSFLARAASAGAGGTIAVHLDSPTGTVVGTCTVPITGNWQTYSTQTCSISSTTGTHNLYLVCGGGSGGLFNLEWIAVQVQGQGSGNLNQQFLASNYNSESPTSGGPWTESCSEGGLDMGNITNGSYAVFNSVVMDNLTTFLARTASAGGGGTIAIHLDSPTGTVIGTCTVPVTGGWQTWSTQSCSISATTGAHNLYLVFAGGSGGIFNLEWFSLQGTNTSTNTTSLVFTGDTINLQVRDGLYLTATNNGGAGLNDVQRTPGVPEQFMVIKLNRGSSALQVGDQIALESSNGTNYLTVESGGTMDATGTSIGTGQTFTLGLSTQ